MKKYEIWSEGFLETGMDGIPEGAFYHGSIEVDNFKNACIKFFAEDKGSNVLFDPERMTYWGCHLFDNESDARKSFG